MRLSKVLLGGLSLFALPAAAFAQQADTSDTVTTNVGRVEVQGAGQELGSGYMVEDDAAKARSTVTREGMANSIATANPYQQITLLPGVSQGQDDALGLSGGVLTVRGMRSDQMGFTINGAPVNDSGNFAVFPQEYVDAENLDQIFVTQGSTDTEAPHVGASGGNIGIVSRAPSDKFGIRGAFTGGQNQLGREFVRLDSGRIGDFQSYMSLSQTDADKWRGDGTDTRYHSDGQVLYHFGDTGHANINWVYNRARNNFYRQIGFTQYGSSVIPYNYDYDTFWGQAAFPVHLTPAAGAQNESTSVADPDHPGAPNATRSNFWPLQVNPFENLVLTGDLNFQVTSSINVDIAPYYWYGTGGGGFGRTESETGNSFSTAVAALGPYGYSFTNLNGVASPAGSAADTDTADTILLYRSSVTRTNRPGVNVRTTFDLGDYNLAIGGWYERARHRQTQPYSYVLNNGSPCDAWLNDNVESDACVVKDASGSVVQGRDQSTISEGRAFYGTLAGNFLQDSLRLTGGLAWRSITRDGDARLPIPLLDPTLPAVSGVVPAGTTISAARYIPQADHPHAEYSEWLPSFTASYQIDHDTQLFADATRNFRVPPNFVFFNYNTAAMSFTAPTTIGGVTYAAGSHPAGTVWIIGDNIKPELSWTYEGGMRMQAHGVRFSATGFFNNIDNYQATAQIDAGTKTTINIGGVEIYGLELEAGTAPWNGFTFYGSLTLQNSHVDDNVAAGATAGVTQHERTAGNQLVDTPNLLAGASIGYSNGPFFFNINPKYTGSRQVSLVNDAQTDGYVSVDGSLGYRMSDHATLRIFAINLFDQGYISEINTNATGTSGAFNVFPTLSVEGNTISAGSIFVTPGAPRFIGASITVDF